MQFSVLITLAFTSAAVLAAPSPRDEVEVPGLVTRQSCTYTTADYNSMCKAGEYLFCSGNTNLCPSGKTDTFDDTATAANEEACAGGEYNQPCTQTVACC